MNSFTYDKVNNLWSTELQIKGIFIFFFFIEFNQDNRM